MKKFLTFVLALAMMLTLFTGAMADDKTTLTILSWWPESQVGELVSAFEAENPDIDVEIQFAAPLNDYVTRFQALNATGELPDMWITAAENRLDVFAGDEAADLGDMLRARGVNPFNIDRYTDENGRVTAYASTAWVGGLACNKDMLAEVGLEVPTDWNSWLNCLKVLQENGKTPIAMNSGTLGDLATMTVAASTVYENPDYDKLVNDDQMTYAEGWIPGLQLWYDTYVASGLTPEEALGMSGDVSRTEFLMGDACFNSCATWDVETIRDSVDFDWTIVPFFGPNGAEVAIGAVGVGWSVNSKSPNYDAAMRFMDFIVNDDGAALEYKMNGGLLCNGDEFEIDERVNHLADLYEEGKVYLGACAWEHSGAINNIVYSGVQEICMETATIEDIANRMDAKHQELSALAK